MEEESDLEIFWRWDGTPAAGTEELEDHAGGVVVDAVEVLAHAREVRETKEREESSVSSKLNTELLLAAARDGSVQVLDDLGRELHSRNCTSVVRGVVCKSELMVVGESAQLEQSAVIEEIRGWDCRVVDLSNVDVIEDCMSRNWSTIAISMIMFSNWRVTHLCMHS